MLVCLVILSVAYLFVYRSQTRSSVRAMAATATAIPLRPSRIPFDYRKAFGLLVTYVLLLLAVTVILFPVFWMASSSLKPDQRAVRAQP